MSNHKVDSGRRQFLQSAASGILLLKPETVFGSQANSRLEIGVIGCGGRGNYIGGFLTEYTNSRIVALADPFREPLEATQQKFKVDSSRLYGGLDGYRQLVASKLDAVAIESPPYFHPEQARAAVEAGKHVYLAKPVAADVAGCLSIAESGRMAQGKVSFLVDFQTRAREAFQEVAKRIHEGAIGSLVLGHVFYHTGRLQIKPFPNATPEQFRLRNWVFDKVISGDVIVEQHIHVLDVANWYAQAHPLKAFGTGGRKARVDVGDAWDHFIVTYWYPNDVKVDFSSAQFIKKFHDMCIRFYGTGGTADTHYGGDLKITGDNPWAGVQKDDTFKGGAVANVKAFVESIQTGKLLNNAATGAESTLTAILGRTAAYRQTTVTWDEMLRSKEKFELNLKI
jgi:myo-inositol 2-dehydrogenase/D-chiro-inositol 1-dehydrogenase